MNERTLRVIIERRPELDRDEGSVRFSGYDFLWEDGTPMDVSLEKLCKVGVRTLIGRKNLGDRQLVELTVRPIEGLDDSLPERAKGLRTRRFYLQRRGTTGIIHLFNGTETTMTFSEDEDEPVVCEWIGLSEIGEGEKFWFDMLARTVQTESVAFASH